jgi:hypothetical protein
MAEKLKGNIFYEILIVILAIVLIWTILYPNKVWENEAELEKVCHTRMETIQNMEFRYIGLNQPYYIYTDSLPLLRDVVMSDPETKSALDSIVMWDDLVMPNDLKTIISERQLPDELRSYIREKLSQGEPLGNLTRWDSLGDKLVKQLCSVLESSDPSMDNRLDSAIVWMNLVGPNTLYQLIDSADVRTSVKNSARTAVRSGKSIIETSGWKYFRPSLYNKLAEIIKISQQQVVWTANEKDDWQKIKEIEYSDELAALPQEEKDTLWVQLQRTMWDKEREVIWRKERKKLWQEEEKDWIYDNETTWKRILNEKWQKERRFEWEEEILKTLKPLPSESEEAEDSTAVVDSDTTAMDSGLVFLEIFQERKRELWRAVEDSLYAREFESWKKKNKKEVDTIIQDLWVGARRITWEAPSYQNWLIGQEKDKEVLWNRIVQETWNEKKDQMWDRELEKNAEKKTAMQNLDLAIEWRRILDDDWLETTVNQLQLPTNKKLLETIKLEKTENKSALYALGLTGLFREALLDSLVRCPLAHEPYLIQAIDTMVVKHFQIECPIQETFILNKAKSDSIKTIAAVEVDPITKQKSVSKLKLSIIKKLLGGGKIKPHGTIETDKKSWDKKGV